MELLYVEMQFNILNLVKLNNHQEIVTEKRTTTTTTSKSLNNRGKSESVKKIRDGLEDYDEEIYRQLHTDKLLDKYNGNKYEDEEEELMMALALSESMNNSRDASEISINESLLTPDDKSQLEEDEQEMDEELRRALELSLIEH